MSLNFVMQAILVGVGMLDYLHCYYYHDEEKRHLMKSICLNYTAGALLYIELM
jgi:hypothetical protein